jgi:hypothetical protein
MAESEADIDAESGILEGAYLNRSVGTPTEMALFVGGVVPPLVHAVIDDAIARNCVAHKDQREWGMRTDRQFPRACDYAGAAGNGKWIGDQGECYGFDFPAHAPGGGRISLGVPS